MVVANFSRGSEVCYQYRCGWDTGVSFIHALRTQTQTTYFCINYPYVARQRLLAVYNEDRARHILHRDFFIDTLVADDSLKQWQFDIGERRLELLDFVSPPCLAYRAFADGDSQRRKVQGRLPRTSLLVSAKHPAN